MVKYLILKTKMMTKLVGRSTMTMFSRKTPQTVNKPKDLRFWKWRTSGSRNKLVRTNNEYGAKITILA